MNSQHSINYANLKRLPINLALSFYSI